MIHHLRTTDSIFSRDPFGARWLPAVHEGLFVSVVLATLLFVIVFTWYHTARGTYRPWYRWLVLTAAGVVYLAHTAFLDVVIEDAFITFRHAENWAAGYGLTWNAGERIEGTSSLLWALVLGLLSRAGAPVPLTAQVLGVVSGLICLVITERLTVQLVQRPSLGALAAVALALNPYFAMHFFGGLETGLFAMLLVLGFLLLVKNRRAAASLVLALATLARPDGAILWLIAIAWGIYVSAGHRRRTAISLAVPYACVVGGAEIWRLSYYGDFLPNSVRAKSGASISSIVGGIRYLWAFMDVHVLVPILIVILAALWLRWRANDGWHAPALLVGAAGTYAIAVVAAGGDWMPGFRYLVPVACFLTPLLVFGVEELTNCVRQRVPGPVGESGGVAVIVCLALLAPSIWVLDSVESFRPEWAFPTLPRARGTLPAVLRRWKQRETDLALLGLWLRKAVPATTQLACRSAGALPYFSRLPTVDMLGLSDRHIARVPPRPGRPAHTRSDDPYVFARRPDIIYVGNGFGASAEKENDLSPLEGVTIEAFRDLYDTVALEIGPAEASAHDHVDNARWATLFILRGRPDVLTSMVHAAEQ